jgi:outer membrane protein OmpA-like peptidoglycan-associated protein
MEYLITSGVPSSAITSVGVGQVRPMADNASAEGRANNRRVEIIIKPAEAR